MSGRMQMNGLDISKAEAVSMVIGRLIDELILRSYRDNGYRHYYDIALVGYSDDSVYSLLEDDLKFYPITLLATRNVRRVPYLLACNTLNGEVSSFCENVSLWVDPRAQGSTPLFKLINRVTTLVEEWCAKEENRDSFPPLVFNISDGEASDADYNMLHSAAQRLKEVGTNDGNTLFLNIHISSNTAQEPITFPTFSEVPTSVRYARLLMDMSSIVPEQFNRYVGECRASYATPPYIAMSYNASLSELVAMLNIGTRSLVTGP
jgi:hypothetical protein